MITKTDIEKYFIAEKQESLVFIIVGVAAVVVAALGLFLWKSQCWRGAAIPLIAIALLQIAVGCAVYARSDAQRIDLVYKLDMNPEELIQKEIPRMETANKNFVIYRWVEIILIIAGITLLFLYKSNPAKQFFYGLGIALAIQALLMLGADFFAEKRAHVYTQQLETLIRK